MFGSAKRNRQKNQMRAGLSGLGRGVVLAAVLTLLPGGAQAVVPAQTGLADEIDTPTLANRRETGDAVSEEAAPASRRTPVPHMSPVIHKRLPFDPPSPRMAVAAAVAEQGHVFGPPAPPASGRRPAVDLFAIGLVLALFLTMSVAVAAMWRTLIRAAPVRSWEDWR